MICAEAIADLLTDALMGVNGLNSSERNRHIYRESLLALIRLAKAEQLLEMQKYFNKLTSVNSPASNAG
jgi:hypothetical protein